MVYFVIICNLNEKATTFIKLNSKLQQVLTCSSMRLHHFKVVLVKLGASECCFVLFFILKGLCNGVLHISRHKFLGLIDQQLGVSGYLCANIHLKPYFSPNRNDKLLLSITMLHHPLLIHPRPIVAPPPLLRLLPSKTKCTSRCGCNRPLVIEII